VEVVFLQTLEVPCFIQQGAFSVFKEKSSLDRLPIAENRSYRFIHARRRFKAFNIKAKEKSTTAKIMRICKMRRNGASNGAKKTVSPSNA